MPFPAKQTVEERFFFLCFRREYFGFLAHFSSRLIPLISAQGFQDLSPPNEFLRTFHGQPGSDEHLSGFHVIGALVQQRHGLNYRVREERANHRIAPHFALVYAAGEPACDLPSAIRAWMS